MLNHFWELKGQESTCISCEPPNGSCLFFQILSTVLCLYHLFVVALVHLFCLGHGRGRDREVWSLH